MGFSVSAAFAVAVIASLIALGMVYPAVSNGFESVSEASQDAGERRLAAANTDIEITQACYDAGADQVELQVENTGSIGLGLDRTHVLVENNLQLSFDDRDVDGIADTAVWAPGETAHITYTYSAQSNIESVDPELSRLTVATEHGVMDSEAIVPC